jgi:hypothetical protein
VAVNGTQKTTNNKSAAAKLMMSTFVVERIVGFAATTEKKKMKYLVSFIFYGDLPEGIFLGWNWK